MCGALPRYTERQTDRQGAAGAAGATRAGRAKRGGCVPAGRRAGGGGGGHAAKPLGGRSGGAEAGPSARRGSTGQRQHALTVGAPAPRRGGEDVLGGRAGELGQLGSRGAEPPPRRAEGGWKGSGQRLRGRCGASGCPAPGRGEPARSSSVPPAHRRLRRALGRAAPLLLGGAGDEAGRASHGRVAQWLDPTTELFWRRARAAGWDGAVGSRGGRSARVVCFLSRLLIYKYGQSNRIYYYISLVFFG